MEINYWAHRKEMQSSDLYIKFCAVLQSRKFPFRKINLSLHRPMSQAHYSWSPSLATEVVRGHKWRLCCKCSHSPLEGSFKNTSRITSRLPSSQPPYWLAYNSVSEGRSTAANASCFTHTKRKRQRGRVVKLAPRNRSGVCACVRVKGPICSWGSRRMRLGVWRASEPR